MDSKYFIKLNIDTNKRSIYNSRRIKTRSTERFIGFYRRPKREYKYTNFEVNNHKGKWCNKIHNTCIKRLTENEDVDSLLKQTEQMLHRTYSSWEIAIKKAIDAVYAPRIIIKANRKNDRKTKIIHDFDIL